MNTKLTLKLDASVIRQAKRHARKNGKTLSGAVEDYFRRLTNRPAKDDRSLPPTVKRLAGVLRRSKIKDHRKAYTTHLDRKYK
ncbi:MAG: antitoxin [Ignavibacteriae bacterium]|nr:antitoxin [Ignavibacteriota bacterium]